MRIESKIYFYFLAVGSALAEQLEAIQCFKLG